MTDENVNLINPKTEVRKGSHQEPKESPHPFQEWGLFSYVFLMVALLIYFLAAFCPQRIPAPSQSGALSQVDSNNTQSHYVWSDIAYPLGKKVEIDFDLRLLLLVFLAGGLGSTIHLATSLGDFIGNNDFKKVGRFGTSFALLSGEIWESFCTYCFAVGLSRSNLTTQRKLPISIHIR